MRNIAGSGSQDVMIQKATTPAQPVSQPTVTASTTASATTGTQPPMTEPEPATSEKEKKRLGNMVYIGGIILLLGFGAIFISFFSDWYPLVFSRAPEYLGPLNMTVILIGVIILIIGIAVIVGAVVSQRRKAAIPQQIQPEAQPEAQAQTMTQPITQVQQPEVQKQPQPSDQLGQTSWNRGDFHTQTEDKMSDMRSQNSKRSL